jgi:hypothetical protein
MTVIGSAIVGFARVAAAATRNKALKVLPKLERQDFMVVSPSGFASRQRYAGSYVRHADSESRRRGKSGELKRFRQKK